MSPSGHKEKNDWNMKKLYTVLFVVAMSLLVSCDRENSDGISNEMAIKMSVSVDKTKAILTTDNIINTSIGVFGYKEQISNQSNKYLVFNNEQLSFESDAWAYSPVRYWDTQTAYSFIAYAPYQENSDNVFLVNDFEGITIKGITIKGIPQWQDADDSESKDYVVALTNSAATNYINNGGVDLKFHHILANLQISAYYEGDDADFVITGLSIGADTCQVPAVDENRSYSQNFGSERADGTFSPVSLYAALVLLTEDGYNYTVSKSLGMAANFLVAPFATDNSKQLPLTITYTENGESKSATVNTGITEFKSDAVYTINLKFTSTVADEPVGPSGPSIEVVPGYTYSLDNSGHNFLCVNSNGKLEVKEVPTLSESIWRTASGTDFYGKENKQPLYIEHDGVIYYLSLASDNKHLTLTTDIQQAMSLYLYQSNNYAPPFLVTDIEVANNSSTWYVVYDEGSSQWILKEYNAGVYLHKVYDMIKCDIDQFGFAGPALFFNVRWDNPNFDYENKVMNYDNIQRLSFNYLLTQGMPFELSFNGTNTMFSYEGNRATMYTQPEQWKCNNGVNDNFDLQWSVAAVDGSDISQYAEMQGQYSNDQYAIKNTLVYKQKCPVDTDVIVTLTCTHRTNPEIVKVGYYRLTLKGANSSN